MALLERNPATLAPRDSEPAPDRAPDELAAGTPEPLRGDLEALLGADRVLARASDIVRYASDASPYRLLPRVVVMAHDAEDVAKVLAYGRREGIPVTFRAGGTSLNGQGQSDGILVDVRRHFSGVAVEDGGATARVKPGTVLGHANRVLAPHGSKLGPDPASTDIATVGGVIANNSGGMRCGTTKDSYSTLRSMTLVLPSGTVIDTAEPGAAARFEAEEPELAAGLAAIRDEIRADTELSERIRRKFEIKNTTGYRLCAFLDADEPLEIFRRLVVGSEGTLAFVAEAVFETVPVPARTTTAWVHFPDIDAAIAPVRDLVEAGATAVELMVAPALITAAWNMVGAPEEWKELPPESAVLLVEFGADDDAELDAYLERAGEILSAHETIRPVAFTREPEEIELAWRVREGLHGLIGKLRPPGTSLIVEDVCVPPGRIAEGARDLQALLGEHGFLPGVAGHASAGNLHFMLTPDFAKSEDLERYEAFMAKLVELIVGKYDGSLKAEHGTGINMAPYVEREWGEAATELMWRVKRLADPDGVLNPGVVLNRDPDAHLRNLKTTPAIEESASACVECGFCEPVCPSRNLTTTPRQRIVLRREMARQPQRLAAAAGAARGVRVRRARDLRRRRLLPARLPGRDRHRGDGQGTARRAPHAAGRSAGPERGEALGRGRERLARRAAGRRAAGAAERARQGAAGARRARSLDLARGRRGGLRPLLHQPDLRRLPDPRPGRGLAARRPAALDSGGLARQLLRAALELERLRRRRRAQVGRAGRAAAPLERGGGAPDRDRRRLLHPVRGGGGRGARGARLRRLGPRPAAAGAGDPRAGRLGHGPPDLRDPPHGPDAEAPGPGRRPRRGGPRPADGHLLRLRRRPRHLPPGADRVGDAPRGGGGRGPRLRRPPLEQQDL